MPVSFGIKTSQMGLSYPDILRVWREADGIGLFEHAWLWDHMVPLRGDVRGAALEAWTLLAALAAQTQRLRLGVIVTSNRLRPPAVQHPPRSRRRSTPPPARVSMKMPAAAINHAFGSSELRTRPARPARPIAVRWRL